jgi:hypothetical protein
MLLCPSCKPRNPGTDARSTQFFLSPTSVFVGPIAGASTRPALAAARIRLRASGRINVEPNTHSQNSAAGIVQPSRYGRTPGQRESDGRKVSKHVGRLAINARRPTSVPSLSSGGHRLIGLLDPYGLRTRANRVSELDESRRVIDECRRATMTKSSLAHAQVFRNRARKSRPRPRRVAKPCPSCWVQDLQRNVQPVTAEPDSAKWRFFVTFPTTEPAGTLNDDDERESDRRQSNPR